MPTFNFGVDSENVVGQENKFQGYSGELPPAGAYKAKLKRLQLVKTGPNSKVPGTPMLKALVEIHETGAKKKYNGYGIFTNIVVTEENAGRVNDFLNSVGGTKERGLKLQERFWGGALKYKGEVKQNAGKDDGHVLSIGNFKVNSPRENGLDVAVSTKRSSYNGDTRLEVTSWLLAKSNGSEDADDLGDDDGDDDILDSDDDFEGEDDDSLDDEPEF